MRTSKKIINPSSLSEQEAKFVEGANEIESSISVNIKPPKIKRTTVLISMPEDLLLKMDTYLKENVHEGTRTQFTVRAIHEYLNRVLNNQ
jgi:hypothetical protein